MSVAHRPPVLRRVLWLSCWLAGSLSLAGCQSFVAEGTSAGAGVAGTALANAVTDNATAAAGIGLGVQAGARAGLQYLQRRTRGEEQAAIAAVAGGLNQGDVGRWEVIHTVPLEDDAQGLVTVSRLIGGVGLECKEIVFSTGPLLKDTDAEHVTEAFYMAVICRDGGVWRWAVAEPATSRWGALQ